MNMKKITLLSVLFFTLLMMVSCTTTTTTTTTENRTTSATSPVTYTVSFNSQGGSTVASQTVEQNALVTEPNDPTKAGFEFTHWYTTNPEVAYDFSTQVPADLTLNALWEEIPVAYVVSFNSAGGSSVASQRIEEGELVSEPEDPTQTGYNFVYWYSTDSEVAYDFQTAIAANFTLTAKWEEIIIVKTYHTVTFNTNGGTIVAPQEVEEGLTATLPTAPTKTDYVFVRWYVTNSAEAYNFSTPVNAPLTLNALFDPTPLTKINADIDAIAESFVLNDYQLNMPKRGPIYKSTITWSSASPYVSKTGVVLPLLPNDVPKTVKVYGTFKISTVTVVKQFEIALDFEDEVLLTDIRSIDFENLTTEYSVDNASIDLYFEDNGSVPYVKLNDFFELLEGFIDPQYIFEYSTDGTEFVFEYEYYDEDEDQIYPLILTINADLNTISTNDPAFYWAYVYSTATNYGRHINYDRENPDAYFDEGNEVVYSLSEYNLDITVVEGEVVLPLYLANQLFAGSSYYNVYYNYDNLYGIYSLPSSGSTEYRKIKTSSMNDEDIPADLIVHTFNMLAFNMNYFYGLQDIMEVDDYYNMLFARKDDLLIADPELLDESIAKFLLIDIDEPHTSYGYPSYFNSRTWDGPATNSLANYGTRFVEWYYAGFVDIDAVIGRKWGEASGTAWNASVAGRPNYWFLSNDTAAIILDGFETADIEEDSVWNSSIISEILNNEIGTLLPELLGGNKYFYYNQSDKTNYTLEVLIKGLDASALDVYKAALLTNEFSHITSETPIVGKEDGYYSKTLNGTDYMVVVKYDETFEAFYIGISDKVPADFTTDWAVSGSALDLIESDSAVFMEFMLDEILEAQPEVRNILLDLSWNTGGNVGALYRVVGFITDQPFRVSSIDGDTGGYSSSYVKIEGVPYHSQLNWALLITPVTFSAANSMATIFMENELGPIIGKKSGGGASSITPILLPNGTAFTMSSNNINAYRTGAGTLEDPYVFHSNEFGIDPTHPININSLYDANVILGILNEVYPEDPVL